MYVCTPLLSLAFYFVPGTFFHGQGACYPTFERKQRGDTVLLSTISQSQMSVRGFFYTFKYYNNFQQFLFQLLTIRYICYQWYRFVMSAL